MALQKQSIPIPFGQGIDTKQDPKQVQMGKLLALSNCVFGVGAQLDKRNGFGLLSTLPADTATTLTTLNGHLLATGSELYEYNAENNAWVDQGLIQPVRLTSLSITRTSASQFAPDMAVASNGLACIAWTEGVNSYYSINNMTTGQAVVTRTALPSTSRNPRVLVLANYFIITFCATVAAAPHLQYIAIPIGDVANPGSATDLTTNIGGLTEAYDTCVLSNSLYAAWNGNDGGGAVRLIRLTAQLVKSSEVVFSSNVANLISITPDLTSSRLFVSWYKSSTNKTYTLCTDVLLATVLSPTETQTGVTLAQLTSYATGNVCTILSENNITYSGVATRSDDISKITCTAAGVVGSSSVVLRGVGLSSKPFLASNGNRYVLCAYDSPLQPTYFLIDMSGHIILKLAYSNGGGYSAYTLPNVCVIDDVNYVPYLYKDLLVPVADRLGSGDNLYTQTGVNVAQIEINAFGQLQAELAGSLHLSGGQLWQYDGIKPVEHSFHLYPEAVTTSTSTTGGNLTAQIYKYSFTYEWTDAAGNLHRSAPSIPVTRDISGSGTSTNTNTIKVPTLRATAKSTSNPVRIVGYRWSTAQQNYYQFTSITSPTLNDTTVDQVTITDTLADSSILGNTLLYTTGGIVENIAAPAVSGLTSWRNRLWLINAENPNELWYSKVLVQGVPVELSDLQTYYVSPTIGAQGNTGPTKAIVGMDDKLIIFKRNAILYNTGQGPDATGANNDYADPIFITSTVGTDNPNSVVATPLGIMFQSDKGIWLLSRTLQTQFIGVDVEAYTNDAQVKSALVIPGTTQIRFNLDSGIVLMYDYYYQQWGTFSNVAGISACLFQDLHTYLDANGQVLQETPGSYLDISRPVLMSLTTAWIKLTDLQGFQRAYFFFLLGQYFSPHLLQISVAYDYDNSAFQQATISPTNYSAPFGDDSLFGGSGEFGGPSNIEQWQVFLSKQKCQAIRIKIDEQFDPSFDTVAGQGLSLSGINFVIGGKALYPKLPASQRTG